MIEMMCESVRTNPATQQRVVILKAVDRESYVCSWIAHAEAYAIALELQRATSPRPLTHDLLLNVLHGMGAKIERVVIADIANDIYIAHLILQTSDGQVSFDARSSDALAIALREGAPIYVSELVMERVRDRSRSGGSSPPLRDEAP